MSEEMFIWRGGEQVIVDNPVKIEQNQTVDAMEKFNTCLHRSDTEIPITIRTCCSSIERPGFRCHKRNIDFLAPSHCGPCNVYEPKKTDKNTDAT